MTRIKNQGFTLIELMISVGIVSILVAIAVPAYRNYVETSELAVLAHNISSIQIFQEEFLLRNGVYSDSAAAIGWDPRTDDATVTYAIVLGGGSTSYEVTATHVNGYSHCITFPTAQVCP